MVRKPSQAPAKKPATPRRKSRFDPKAAFTEAMMSWFEERDYDVGLDLGPLTGDEGKAQYKKLLSMVAKFMPATGMHFLITDGANSDALSEALAPFIGQADLVASNMAGGGQPGLVVLPLLLFADTLAPEEIRRRFALFLELGEALDEFGPRLNFQSMGHCRLYPLLVYFDSAKCRADVEALLAEAWEVRAWKHVALRGAFVDLGGGNVTWAEMTGISAIGASIGSLFGLESDLFHFTPADLAAVRAAAGLDKQSGA